MIKVDQDHWNRLRGL